MDKFGIIFRFEVSSWFNRPALYIYAALILVFSAFMVAIAGGVFESNTATVTSLKYINSPNGILQLVIGIAVVVFLLFPNIVGSSIHKDFETNTYKVLYSFPITKSSYFFGKYLSALFICLLLTLCVLAGVMLGFLVPGVKQDLIGPHRLWPYIKVFLIYLVPATIFFSAMVFGIVTYTRSVVAGFVAMIVLYLVQGFVDSALSSNDYYSIGALVDPFGEAANRFYTRYWTIDEENNAPIPFKGYVIFNRLIWLSVGFLILIFSFVRFKFQVIPNIWTIFKKKENERSIAHKAASVTEIKLPTVDRKSHFMNGIRSAWSLFKIDLKFILTGGPFVVITIIGLLFLVLLLAFGGQFLDTKTFPTTSRVLLVPGFAYGMFITLLTFVYAGLLINRRRTNNIYQLEDVTPNPNWSFMLSKFISLTLMQGVLLTLPIIAGIAYQISQNYFEFEFGLYFFDSYLVKWVRYIPWTLMALLIYVLISNYYIGLVVCLIIGIGTSFLSFAGIEQSMFKYNEGVNAIYSDIDSYGRRLPLYYYYRLYWIFGGVFLTLLGTMLWNRGVETSLISRIKNLNKNNSSPIKLTALFSLLVFLGLGANLYYQTNVVEEFKSSKHSEKKQVNYEKKYKRYEYLSQPRVTAVNIDVELYPARGDFEAKGYYWLKNKSQDYIDTLFVLSDRSLQDIQFSAGNNREFHDPEYDIYVYSLENALAPQDSIRMDFVIKNKPNTIFNQDILVRKNGTFLNSRTFPMIGYQPGIELSNKQVRKKYDLPHREIMADHSDSTAYANTYISNFADWIDFEMKIGTSKNQIAMAPGKLIKEWEDNNRRYYHYKMDQPMLNFYNISSAEYEVAKDTYNGIDLSIYYHKAHNKNIDRMMSALKDGLAYYEENFSPYQFDQVRILEFPRGSFAQSFANTIPFSENVGFVAQVDDDEDGGVDYPYITTAHELAHQWWAHQVIGANVKGATMMSESLSEYSSLKVLEKRYGVAKMRKFLKDALDKYLLNRSLESDKELPLAYTQNQQYIHYQKGSLVFYALSDYLGEKNLNGILSAYIDSVGFQQPPYTTSLELLAMIKAGTPDSLMYFVEDNFEHITVYDNRIEDANFTENDDGTYTVDITAHVRKYRTTEKGKPLYTNTTGDSLALHIDGKSKPVLSYPLDDYLDLAIFGQEEVDGKTEETILYQKRINAEEISNTFSITVDEKPIEVGIDPFNKLIDRNSDDNRRRL